LPYPETNDTFTNMIKTESRNIQLSDVFSHNMMFQRHKPQPVWGTGTPGNHITVTFGDQTIKCQVKEDGTWIVNLKAMQACTIPQVLEVSNSETAIEIIRIRNIIIGDIWFCSGQSNMEMGITMSENWEAEVKGTALPEIRYLLINKTSAPLPIKQLNAQWKECLYQNIIQDGWGGFSALCFYFARKLHKEQQIPVGIIQSAFGGCSIHPWILPSFLARFRSLKGYYQEYMTSNARFQTSTEHPFAPFTDYSVLKPSTIYHAMVHPLLPFPIKGVLWYQGESNVPDKFIYAEKLKALILSFRKTWKNRSLPVYYAQIAPWQYENQDELLGLWEALYACESIRQTGMVVTVDTGDVNDIHPVKKKPVGERFALLALARTYGHTQLCYQGPVLKTAVFKPGYATLTFSHTCAGLVASDNQPLRWFELAGKDRIFHKAEAEIQGNRIVVRASNVANPVAVRYAWYANVEKVNFYNQAGLPARPFRTDKW